VTWGPQSNCLYRMGGAQLSVLPTKIVLIDGSQLADLIIDRKLGVS